MYASRRSWSRLRPHGSLPANRPGDWSPDGQRIVFGTGDLWIMAPDGTNLRAILADSALNFEAAWTPAAP